MKAPSSYNKIILLLLLLSAVIATIWYLRGDIYWALEPRGTREPADKSLHKQNNE